MTPHPERFVLAQLNVAVLRAAIDSAEMAEFAALLDPVNRIADEAAGFIWRHRPSGVAEVREDNGAALLIVNLSVWRDLESLKTYVYSGAHLDVMRRRGEWLRRMAGGSVVLWWVAEGARPTVDDGLERLAMLRSRGATADAFTFRTPMPPPIAIPIV